MTMSKRIQMSAAAMILALAGCGGGGGGGSGSGSAAPATTLVGTFIDAPVAGLEFESASGGGVTDANGNFTYQAGESVNFHIGNLQLGQAVPHDGLVTPLDTVGTTDAADPRVVRILQTLQSLDTNGGAGNVIQISAGTRDALRTQPTLDLTSSSVTNADLVATLQANDSMSTGVTATIGGSLKVAQSVAVSQFAANLKTQANPGLGYTPAVPAATASGGYSLVAWNDLGMHCVDGKDYSVFSILPPYNNLHAHLVNRSVNTGKLAISGVTLTYESVADPAGSINTSSASKTNFWTWAKSLFGLAANLPPNIGLTGNPAPSKIPAALAYSAKNGWWEATGIPLMPYDDSNAKNYYPMVKVVARNNSGTVLASTNVVLPVSDEMSCKSCHASTSGPAAKPAAGWVNDADPEKDWKRNILRLHDEKVPNAIALAGKQTTYTGGSLSATAAAGTPILCAGCHKSNALSTPLITGVKPLTEAMHAKHSTVNLPGTSTAMDSSTTRDSCYQCHPGSTTKCLRGVMGNAKTVSGSNAIDCQSCHGNMSKVGASGREGWLDEPACQNCHDRSAVGAAFTRYLTVFGNNGQLRTTIDRTFATQTNMPVAGKSLYRFSAGHGGMQCEACHGATHAEYPSSHPNDNVQSQALQGHVGTIAECTVCHATVPTTTNGGPHGMHTVGQAWISNHEGAARSSLAACAVCHGSDYRGTPLSKTSMARSFAVEGGSKTFASGQSIGCYSCHNGPNGG